MFFFFKEGSDGSDFYPLWLWLTVAQDRNLVVVIVKPLGEMSQVVQGQNWSMAALTRPLTLDLGHVHWAREDGHWS